MAKLKADWLKEAEDLGIEVDDDMTVPQLQELIQAELDNEREAEDDYVRARRRSGRPHFHDPGRARRG